VKLSAMTSAEISSGRYTNSVQCAIQPEELVLDFYSRCGEDMIHLGRYFMSPAHARRLVKLLSRQLERYEDTFGDVHEPDRAVKPTAKKAYKVLAKKSKKKPA